MAVFDGVIPAIVGAANAAAVDSYEIERSLRFNDDDTAYLNRTPSGAGNQKTWTWSAWAKRSKIEAEANLFSVGASSTDGAFRFNADDTFLVRDGAGGELITSAYYGDPSAWYHIVVALDTTQSTSSNRFKLYINGVEPDLGSASYAALNADGDFNAAVAHYVGRQVHNTANLFDGYLAEIHFVDGQQLAASDFGEYDDNNVWQPKEYSGSYGTNGFYLKFDDNSSAAALGTDSSGNSNTWTVNNISVSPGAGNDSLIDTPTNYTASSGNNGGNYCTFSPLALSDSTTNPSVSLGNGNLEVRNARTNYWGTALSTFSLSSGKWYFEASCIGSISWSVGIYGVDPIDSRFYTDDEAIGYSATGYEYKHTGDKQNNLSSSSYGASYSGGDVIGVALDLDGGTLTFYKNGTSQGTAFSSLSGRFALAVSCSGANSGWNLNFGQRAFTYQNAGTDRPANTFKAVCTANLPSPTIAKGSTAFNAAIWTGDGTSGRNIPTGHSSDFVWLKRRDTTNNFSLTDIIRGVNVNLRSSTNGAETTDPNSLTGFDTDGFTVGSDSAFNGSGGTFVGWSWDAGSSTGSNTDGTITSQVRANTSAGFSVVSYTGTGNSDTVGHGLNASPGMILVKDRGVAVNWAVYHSALGTPADDFLVLNNTDGEGTISGYWGTTNSSAFGLIAGTYAHNRSGNTYIAYCFAPVEGYSAFGSYTGNGSTDGPSIYTGFAPRWVLFKRTDTGGDNWTIFDTARDTNPLNVGLEPNSSAAEQTFGNRQIETKANGFKVTSTGASSNANGGTYIYAAFAEHPFKTARAQ